MKKTISIISTILLISLTINSTNALDLSWPTITITNNSESLSNTELSRWEIFNIFANYYEWKIPNSYKYIKVNFKDVLKWSILEASLQKLIYLNLIENPSREILKDEKLNAWWFYRLAEKIFKIKIIDSETKKELLSRNATNNDKKIILDFLSKNTIKISTEITSQEIKQKIAILQDVYNTIIIWHYDKENLDEWKMIDSAIEWMAHWTDDKHTVYFPPIESESFQDSLSGEYEWIWSYVDMEKPGAVRIISPIPWSPSEKSWLKWWDLIIKVDSREITEKNSLHEVITWIKWPAWSTVILTIDRDWSIFNVEVTREKIIINDIESKAINSWTYYIQIKSFWEHVSRDFKETIQKIKNDRNINKIIIDLRNNWGGYLDQVIDILSYFVKEWEKTAIVKYHDSEKSFISKWYDLIDFSKYKIVILQNSWTASASEILIWTLKDYYPKIELIWENSYWKWSVQVIKNYNDGSILKYTIAKWFTGLTETWIDQVWIKPSIELEFDLERYKKNWFDNQLDKALHTN